MNVIKNVSLLYALSRQRGKIVAFALVVSMIIAWQTLHILETGWRDRRLLNQRMLAVQTRQAVLSMSSAVLNKLAQPDWRNLVFDRLNSGFLVSMCLNASGELVNSCNNSAFVQGIDVDTTINLMETPLVDLSGDSWRYLRITSRGKNILQVLTESVSLSVNNTSGEIRIQQRYWLSTM